MNTKTPVFVVLSLGVAVAIVQGSGVINMWGMAGPADDMKSGDELRRQYENHKLQKGEGGGFNGTVNPSSDSDIVGIILGTVPKMIGLLVVPGLLSHELATLGLWTWAAVPIGLLANIVTYIGGFQIVSGRIYE